MSVVLSCFETKQPFSYQHLQGVMLVNLNKLAAELNLSHREYRLLGTLIGLWNINIQKSFPTIDYLAKTCCMSKSTITTLLKNLTVKGLLVIDKTNSGKNYYSFSNKFLNNSTRTSCKTSTSTSCKTPHDIKPIKTKTKLNNISRKYTNNLNQQALYTILTIDDEYIVLSNKGAVFKWTSNDNPLLFKLTLNKSFK